MYEEHVLDVIVHLLNGWLGFRYAETFLRRKHENRQAALLFWIFIYVTGQMLWGMLMKSYPLYDGFTHVLPYLFLLAVLQRGFFERDLPRQIFMIASFIAGWEILRFAVSPLAHAILGLWGPLWGWMLEHLVTGGFLSVDALTENMLLVNRVVVFAILFLCRGVQLGVFFLYLRMLGKYFVPMDEDMSAQEVWFLLTPCVTVLTIDLTLRLMAYSVDNSALMIVYERVPETLVLLPVASILLLSLVVSSVVLFRGLVQFKDEERRRLLLENRVTDVHRQIEDLQDLYGDMRGLRHDLRAHIANITSYVRNRKGDGNGELESYLNGMENTIARMEFDARTGNPITDVILHQARQQAMRKNISFNAEFHFPQNAALDVYDVSVILNNALQNAVEACEKLDGRKHIELRSYEKGSLFFLEVENDFDGHLIWKKEGELLDTTKEEKRIHGIGLDNIRRCARKYCGDVEVEVSDKPTGKIFRLTVMLYRREAGSGKEE